MEYAALCKCCTTIADCKAAYGKFWEDKSNGGVGCFHQFPGWGKKPAPSFPKMPRRPRKMVQPDLI